MPWTKVMVDHKEFEDTLAREGLRGITYKQALNEAQRQLLETDDRVYIIGEGVDDVGGVFGSTSGLAKDFGPRVMDMPIAENGLTGIAVGSAICGMRPVFVHMRSDFLPMCLDQIANHAAKWSYMTNGTAGAPIVIRHLVGKGWGSAAQHSQALHGLFTQFAGLKVAVPSTPYDAKGLLISAVRDGNPVLFCEHRWLYDFMGYVPQEIYAEPFGKGVIRRKGADVTIVAISLMVYEAVKAARILEKEGIDAEIVDPRTLKPFDEDMVLTSVKKTGRLIVADAATANGAAAEITALVCEHALSSLKAAPRRVCLPDTPTPASPALEKVFYPTAETIAEAARQVVKAG